MYKENTHTTLQMQQNTPYFWLRIVHQTMMNLF